jgi:hypothetical protein
MGNRLREKPRGRARKSSPSPREEKRVREIIKEKHMRKRGVVLREKKIPKLVSKVAKYSFEREEDLNNYIRDEGTFRDRVAALSLELLKNPSASRARELSRLAKEDNGDKSLYALKYLVKIVLEAQEEGMEELKKVFDEKELASEFVLALEQKMRSPFVGKSAIHFVEKLIGRGVMGQQILSMLLDLPSLELAQETRRIVQKMVREREEVRGLVVRKLCREIVSKRSAKDRVKGALFISTGLPASLFKGERKEMEGMFRSLERHLRNGLEKKEPETLFIKCVSGGISWLCSEAGRETVEPFFTHANYLVFRCACHKNSQVSLNGLRVLERVHSLGIKVNWTKTLVDSISRHILSKEDVKASLLNLSLDIPSADLIDRVIKSCYVVDLNGVYTEGALILISENRKVLRERGDKTVHGESSSIRLGLFLLAKSFDKEVSSKAAALIRGESLEVSNPWEGSRKTESLPIEVVSAQKE